LRKAPLLATFGEIVRHVDRPEFGQPPEIAALVALDGGTHRPVVLPEIRGQAQVGTDRGDEGAHALTAFRRPLRHDRQERVGLGHLPQVENRPWQRGTYLVEDAEHDITPAAGVVDQDGPVVADPGAREPHHRNAVLLP
jgi:hypothetical protein